MIADSHEPHCAGKAWDLSPAHQPLTPPPTLGAASLPKPGTVVLTVWQQCQQLNELPTLHSAQLQTAQEPGCHVYSPLLVSRVLGPGRGQAGQARAGGSEL